eukprot:g3306.t1
MFRPIAVAASASPTPSAARPLTPPILLRSVIPVRAKNRTRYEVTLLLRQRQRLHTTRFSHTDWIKFKIKHNIAEKSKSLGIVPRRPPERKRRRVLPSRLCEMCWKTSAVILVLTASAALYRFLLPSNDTIATLNDHGIVLAMTLAPWILIYGAIQSVRTLLLPSRIVLEYHKNQAPQIRKELLNILRNDRWWESVTVCTLLGISQHALLKSDDERSLPGVLKEGQVLFKQYSRRTWEENRRSALRVDCFCARCSLDFGRGRPWHRRWAILRSSGITLLRDPLRDTTEPTDVLLFGASFYCLRKRFDDDADNYNKHSAAVVVVAGSNWVLEMKLSSEWKAKQWASAITHAATRAGATDWTTEHRFGSFAPVRKSHHHRNNVVVDSRRKITSTSHARWLLNGRAYFAAVARAIRAARRDVYVCGWFLSPEVLLLRRANGDDEDLSLVDLIREVAARGVHVYVLLYHEVPGILPNNSWHAKTTLENVNNVLKTRRVFVLRHRSRFSSNVYWSHHEKVVVVDSSVAFVGGIDLAFGRYCDARHAVVDRRGTWPGKDYSNGRIRDMKHVENARDENINRARQPRLPWRDVAMQTIGHPAADTGRHFVERWQHVRQLASLFDKYPALQPREPHMCPAVRSSFDDDSKSSARTWPRQTGRFVTCDAQILRSLCRWSAGTQTENSVHLAYCSQIERAKRFVYIENQYFVSGVSMRDDRVSNRVACALADRLCRAVRDGETHFRAILVLPALPDCGGILRRGESGAMSAIMFFQYRTICRGEDSIVARLTRAIRATGKDKEGVTWRDYLRIFSLRSYGRLRERYATEMVYVHSKLAIFDDTTTLIGSANVNDRSMTGDRDSEIVVSVVDSSKCFGRSLRLASMGEFLGTKSAEETERLYMDIGDKTVWDRLGAIAERNARVFHDVFRCLPCDEVRSWRDLKMMRADSAREGTLYRVGAAEEIESLREAQSWNALDACFGRSPRKRRGIGREGSPHSRPASPVILPDGTKLPVLKASSLAEIGEQTDSIVYAPSPEEAETRLSDVRGFLVTYPTEFLSDEVLEPAALSVGRIVPDVYN